MQFLLADTTNTWARWLEWTTFAKKFKSFFLCVRARTWFFLNCGSFLKNISFAWQKKSLLDDLGKVKCFIITEIVFVCFQFYATISTWWIVVERERVKERESHKSFTIAYQWWRWEQQLFSHKNLSIKFLLTWFEFHIRYTINIVYLSSDWLVCKSYVCDEIKAKLSMNLQIWRLQEHLRLPPSRDWIAISINIFKLIGIHITAVAVQLIGKINWFTCEMYFELPTICERERKRNVKGGGDDDKRIMNC